MSWLYYLLEANLYLILFYGFYRLFLHRETFYGLNRSYLIVGSILAFLLPFFQLGFLKAPVIEQITAAPTTETVVSQVMMTENLPLETYQPSILTMDNAIIAIYSLVTIAFLLKMLFNLSKIISMRKLPSVKLDNGVKLIDLKDSKIAFSFFNLLFLDPQLAEKNTILKHELVHIKQKHSLDVLLFEIIQIINWFNPIVYLVKKDIKLIHEYLADEETTKHDVEKYHYAMFLIQNSTGIQNLTLTNQIFSSSILKKRISMLNQKKSAHWAKLKLLVVLPIIAGILCISTMAFTKDYGFVDLLPVNANPQEPAKKVKGLPPPTVETVKFDPPPIYKPKNQKFFYIKSVKDYSAHKYISKEDRYIIINGKPVKDVSKFYGVAHTTSILILNKEEAQKKYGAINGKNGAVEITGKNIKYVTTLDFPPPPKIEQIKFPPPAIKKDKNKTPPSVVKVDEVVHLPQTYFYARNTYYQGKAIKPDPRFIVVNGQGIEDNKLFVGVQNAESVRLLTQFDAVKKYGDKGKNGAIEISGNNIKTIDKFPTPPPFPKLTLDRAKSELLVIPDSDYEIKTLTIYNKHGEVVYNTTDYKNDWNGKRGNYGNFVSDLPRGSYQYFMKIAGEPLKNKRGAIDIKD